MSNQSVTDGASQDEVFRALADPTRREILELLRQERKSAGEIAEAFPVSRPAISKHLRLLREAGLVVERKKGRHRLYALTPAPLRALDDWVSDYRRFWTDGLQRLKELAESDDLETGEDER